MLNELAPYPCALGGGPLEGNRLVRFAYIDEAGISDKRHEPVLVVAGVLVHADTQWKTLEACLAKIANDDHPKRLPPGFVLHATELFSGGKVLPRESWPKEIRWQILDKLARVPASHDLPIAYGLINKSNFPAFKLDHEPTKEELAVGSHAIAFTACCIAVERIMKTHFPDEVVVLVAEDNHQMRRVIKDMHAMYRDREKMKEYGFGDVDGLPFNHIVDTVHFAGKTESSLLQIADTCAFAIKRKLMKCPEANRFFDPIRGQLSWWHRDLSDDGSLD